jgi:hypothetical protein
MKEKDLDCNSNFATNEKSVQCINLSEYNHANSALDLQACSSVKKRVVQDSVSGERETQRTDDDQCIKSSKRNHVPSTLDSQASLDSNEVVLQDSTRGETVDIQRTEEDSVNQVKMNAPAKRTRRHPSKRNQDFLW